MIRSTDERSRSRKRRTTMKENKNDMEKEPFSPWEEAAAEAEEILGADEESIAPAEAGEILKRLEKLYDILAEVNMEDEDSEEAAALDELLEEMDDMMDGLREMLEP